MSSAIQAQPPTTGVRATDSLVVKTVSATEAKARLSSLMRWATKNRDGVIVQSRGNPQAAIISFDEYERLQQLKEQISRQEALGRLKALAQEARQRNADLSPGEVERLAEETSQETIKRMVEEGTVRFEE
jgi:prevent-host-death family protein